MTESCLHGKLVRLFIDPLDIFDILISTRLECKIEAKSKCIDVGQLDCLVLSLPSSRVEFTRRPHSLTVTKSYIRS